MLLGMSGEEPDGPPRSEKAAAAPGAQSLSRTQWLFSAPASLRRETWLAESKEPKDEEPDSASIARLPVAACIACVILHFFLHFTLQAEEETEDSVICRVKRDFLFTRKEQKMLGAVLARTREAGR